MKQIKINLTEQEVQELASGESIFIHVGPSVIDTQVELYQGAEEEYDEDDQDVHPDEEKFNNDALLGKNPLKPNDTN